MGDKETEWATDMLKFDLSKLDGQWEKVEVPFQTRALAVVPNGNQLVVVGGLKSDGGPTDEVHIYDLKTNQWTAGPSIPAPGRMKAFGCSAVSVGDHVLASTYDGGIYQLNDDNRSWSQVYQLDDGRFFHQMLPIAENKFAIVGGSHMKTGSKFEIEVIEILADVSQSKAKSDE